MKRFALVVVLTVFLITVVHAQDQAGQKVSLGYWIEADLTKVAQLEEGMKAHINWHRNRKDSHGYATWQLLIGSPMGAYAAFYEDAPFADYDKLTESDAEDAADFLSKVGDSVKSLSTNMSTTLAQYSKFPGGQSGPSDGDLASVITFHLKTGGEAGMMTAIKRFHAAVEKIGGTRPFIWVMDVAGGSPTVSVVLPIGKFANMAGSNPFEVMIRGLGIEEALTIRKAVDDAVMSEESTVWRYRGDLSYKP